MTNGGGPPRLKFSGKATCGGSLSAASLDVHVGVALGEVLPALGLADFRFEIGRYCETFHH